MDVELILMRQLASYLSVPMFLIGMDGKLLFYNEAAERHLGRRFEEAGEMPVSELSDIFEVMTEDGAPFPPEELPIAIALRDRRPAHRVLAFRGLDGVQRHIEVTAFPIEGHAGRHVGAAAVFWEKEAS